MKVSKELSNLTVTEVTELARRVSILKQESVFTMDGPSAWPGGGSTPNDCWYRKNDGPWIYTKEAAGIWAYESMDVEYLCYGSDRELIHVMWKIRET